VRRTDLLKYTPVGRSAFLGSGYTGCGISEFRKPPRRIVTSRGYRNSGSLAELDEILCVFQKRKCPFRASRPLVDDSRLTRVEADGL
jgi:hypothetical protein